MIYIDLSAHVYIFFEATYRKHPETLSQRTMIYVGTSYIACTCTCMQYAHTYRKRNIAPWLLADQKQSQLCHDFFFLLQQLWNVTLWWGLEDAGGSVSLEGWGLYICRDYQGARTCLNTPRQMQTKVLDSPSPFSFPLGSTSSLVSVLTTLVGATAAFTSSVPSPLHLLPWNPLVGHLLGWDFLPCHSLGCYDCYWTQLSPQLLLGTPLDQGRLGPLFTFRAFFIIFVIGVLQDCIFWVGWYALSSVGCAFWSGEQMYIDRPGCSIYIIAGKVRTKPKWIGPLQLLQSLCGQPCALQSSGWSRPPLPATVVCAVCLCQMF